MMILSPLKIPLICLMLSGGFVLAQDDCKGDYDRILKLEKKSFDIFFDSGLTLTKQIEVSKRKAQDALAFGYKSIKSVNCVEYSDIVDMMIELELQISRPDSAEKLALERLHRVYPGWMDADKVIKVKADDLYVLYEIYSSREGEDFYQAILKNGGPTFGCGMVIGALGHCVETTKFLQSQYEEIYSYRFLQNVGLPINFHNKPGIPYWIEMYDLLIAMMVDYNNIDSIIVEYNNAPILDPSYTKGLATYQKPYIEVGNIQFRLLLKDQFNGRKTRIFSPEELEAIKTNSLFYQRLLDYKSMH